MDAVHGQFGSAFLQRWRFDDALIQVALLHHPPQKSFVHTRAVSAVARADAIVCQTGIGDEHVGYAGVPLDPHPSALFLNLPPERLQALSEGGQAPDGVCVRPEVRSDVRSARRASHAARCVDRGRPSSDVSGATGSNALVTKTSSAVSNVAAERGAS